MTQEQDSFQAGIDFESVLRIISKQVYETPLAFIRENVQNAVDAIRIQAHRDGVLPGDDKYRIDVTVDENKIVVRDNGIGMSDNDLKSYFWTIGASGKRTPEALAAGCVGTFGIGGFANFGVCSALEVNSKTEMCEQGTLTRLSEADIKNSGTTIPSVTREVSDIAAPRGTVVVGYLRKPAPVNELRSYLLDFVRYVPTAVHFNEENISQKPFSDVEEKDNLTPIDDITQEWREGDFVIAGRMFEDRGLNLAVSIENLFIAGEAANLKGTLKFLNGPIDVFKRGFKLCTVQIGCTIGVSGRLNCDRFVPTAGRDSLDSETMSLLHRIVSMLEKTAIEVVLESTERIAQHARIFQYVVRNGWVEKLDNAPVLLADGLNTTLGDVRRKAENEVGIFFGVARKQSLHQIMQARGHVVLLLSADRYRRDAERLYLERFCSGKPFDGVIDCTEYYQELTRFEKVFLSELELSISRSYEVQKFRLIPGKLTEDIPVFLREQSGNQPVEIYVDVRHSEVTKLEMLGYTDIFYSLISTFCREYLGPSLKQWSPRFFGDGSLNLEFMSKRRSELWILVQDDIGVVHKAGQRGKRGQRLVVTRADVQEVTVGKEQGQEADCMQNQPEPSHQKSNPRILRIVDEAGTTGLGGYYIRVPDAAFNAYGDLLPACENRGVVWAGNKITFVASDSVSAAFQYEIRLDELITVKNGSDKSAGGAIPLEEPLQEMFAGIYFLIPPALKDYLVPAGDREIRVYLYCEWIDMRTAKHWLPRESST